jgi:hypothetical protein
MKRNTHVIVPAARFALLRGGDALRTYRFGTRTAAHHFCGTCGICPFYRPRSSPDAYAVTLPCLNPASLGVVTVRRIDGRHWEAAVAASGIAQLSRG